MNDFQQFNDNVSKALTTHTTGIEVRYDPANGEIFIDHYNYRSIYVITKAELNHFLNEYNVSLIMFASFTMTLVVRKS